MGSVYECPGCGYQYHQDLGDEHEGFIPGTPFDDLPEGWVCPDCSVRYKEDFQALN